MVGVFAATDVFLFYVFFEAMLVPMYFLIGSFGGPRRQYAAVKFFLYSLVGGLFMLAAVIGLYVVSAASWARHLRLRRAAAAAHHRRACRSWLFLGFFVAFAIKAPLLPFHTWLPDAGAAAPVGGAVLLVGVLDKVGTFGILRYCLPLFPDASRYFAPLVLVLAVVGILYAALLAIGQSDLKRLVAYTSIAHFGFIALGIFAFTTQAGTGAVLYMVNHGLATGLLFLVVGMLIARGGSRQIGDFGGARPSAPVLAGVFLIAGLASLALPGTAQLRQRVPGADRHVHGAAGVHGHRHGRHHPGRALHPADGPAHDAGPGPRRAAEPTDADAAEPARAPRRWWRPPRLADGRRAGALRVLDLDRREIAVVTPLIALIIALGFYPQPLHRPDRPGRAGDHERRE